MEIKIIKNNKKQFLDLLLLADEEENMIDKYLNRGTLFALYDLDLKSICVVTKEDSNIYELKNIATYKKYQGQGYGKKLIKHIFKHYKNHCTTMLVGTGDCPFIIQFYKSCGFIESHRIKNFFTNNYSEPIFEEGIQLIDMIYLKKNFS
jgi:GNAT superfamily N-acetyltransferase